ncbi:MAG: AMP-binding protein, partial [Bacilli bacterium]
MNPIQSAAEMYGNKVALMYEGRVWSFDELHEEVQRYAYMFESQGVREGMRVVCFWGNQQSTVFSLWALLSLGCTVVPLNLRLTEQEWKQQMSDVDPHYWFSNVALQSRFDCPQIHLREDVSAQRALSVNAYQSSGTILFTSGTTGR